MLIFFHGPDTLSLSRRLREIIETQSDNVEVRVFDCENSSIEEVRTELEMRDLFHKAKLLVLKGACQREEVSSELAEITDTLKNTEHTIIFVEQGVPDAKNPLVKFLKKGADTEVFNVLNGPALTKWILSEFASYGVESSPSLIAKLAEEFGKDLWECANEIAKLASFKASSKKAEKEDLAQLRTPRLEAEIFPTIDAIAQGNKKQSLELISRHLNRGDHPLYLLSMIAYQFRNIMTVKDMEARKIPYASIPKQSGLHPFVVKKCSALGRSFKIQDLKGVHEKIFQTDYLVKTGRMEPETALQSLLLSL